jgi:tetratricopeptide (TPR) repeat protein
VPVFFLGVLALSAVLLGRAGWRPTGTPHADRDLAALRQLLDRPGAAPAELLAVLTRLAGQADRLPADGDTHLLLGSAHLRVAEKRPDAADHLRKARTHLEEAARLGVAADARRRLAYRLGKVLFREQADPARAAELLAAAVDGSAEDPAEGYAMLTQAYLRLPEPRLDAALDANLKLLQLPTDDPAVLAPARIQRGELLFRKGQRDEARKVLEGVKPPAAPGLVAHARYLRALSHQHESHFQEAAPLWEEALADPATAPQNRGPIRCWLGTCYLRLGQRADAVRVWEGDNLWQAGGEVGSAVALQLAAAHLPDNPAAALRAFEQALRGVQKPPDWKNTVIDLTAARQTFEEGGRLLRERHEYEAAMKLARLYEKLAAPGAAAALFAEAAEDAARAKANRARELTSEEAARQERKQARELFLQAAAKFQTAADAAPDAADQAARLWRAAHCSRLGEDHEGAAAVLERYVGLEPAAEEIGQAWYLLGEARRALGQDDKAAAAYEKAMQRRGPFEFRSRYELAMLKVKQNAFDEAQWLLERNMDLIRKEPDAEAHEKTAFALADLFFRRALSGELTPTLTKELLKKAVFLLEQTLRLFPSSPRALVGSYQLAESYRHLAFQLLDQLRDDTTSPATRAFLEGQYQDALGQAAAEYAKLAELMRLLQASGSLGKDEEKLLRQVSFAEAECRLDLGKYEDALQLYKKLAARYPERVESLHAWAGVRKCYWLLDKQEPGRHTQDYLASLDHLARALADMNEAAFEPAVSLWTRKQWDDWLAKERQKDSQQASQGGAAAGPR